MSRNVGKSLVHVILPLDTIVMTMLLSSAFAVVFVVAAADCRLERRVLLSHVVLCMCVDLQQSVCKMMMMMTTMTTTTSDERKTLHVAFM